jgi:hypothetical protein
MKQRIFTLEEARRALPLVRQVAEDLQRVADQIGAIPNGIPFVYGVVAEDDLPDDARARLVSLRDQLHALVRELGEIGVALKGLQPVLVDFPWEREGQQVLLCWAVGEPDILHWHTPEGGFRGRQKL